MNEQPVEPLDKSDGLTLDVHSIFHTIQGEGPFAGHRAVFIRLAGCNLACPHCDTEYTEGRQRMSVEDIREKVGAMQQDGLVVITGGEPFRQDINALVYELLLIDDYTVQVETNGTAPPPKYFERLCSRDLSKRHVCFVVCSPKTPKIHPRLEPLVAAYKYVLSPGAISHTDGLPIEVLGNAGFKEPTHRPSKTFSGPIYVQPCDFHHPALNEHSRDTAVGVVMKHGYILQLQIHKLINME